MLCSPPEDFFSEWGRWGSAKSPCKENTKGAYGSETLLRHPYGLFLWCSHSSGKMVYLKRPLLVCWTLSNHHVKRLIPALLLRCMGMNALTNLQSLHGGQIGSRYFDVEEQMANPDGCPPLVQLGITCVKGDDSCVIWICIALRYGFKWWCFVFLVEFWQLLHDCYQWSNSPR